MYGSSQLGWNFPFVGLAVFSKTLLKTNSLGRNVRVFTRQLCKFPSLCWYDVMRTAAASRSSSVMSRSLTTALAFAFLGISLVRWNPDLYGDDGFHPIREGEW